MKGINFFVGNFGVNNGRYTAYCDDRSVGLFLIALTNSCPKHFIKVEFKNYRTGLVRKVRYYRNGKLCVS